MESELEIAHTNLTDEQKKEIKRLMQTTTMSVSGIACFLGLTRSFVHSYVKKLNEEMYDQVD